MRQLTKQRCRDATSSLVLTFQPNHLYIYIYIHSTLNSNTSPQRVLNNKGVGAGYIYRRLDYFFIADRQACFVGAWRSHSSGSYDSIYINAVFMRSFFDHTCLHIVWFLITRSLVKTYLHAGSC